MGVIEGVRRVLSGADVAPSDVSRVVHGTTLATNVILEQKGSPSRSSSPRGSPTSCAWVGRLGWRTTGTTSSSRLRRRRSTRNLTFEVPERMKADGSVLRALSADGRGRRCPACRRGVTSAVAICLLNAYTNPEHERIVAHALRAALPDAFVVASTEVWPEMREYERAMTTVMCAYVGPVMAGYLAGLESQPRRARYRWPARNHGLERWGDVGVAWPHAVRYERSSRAARRA